MMRLQFAIATCLCATLLLSGLAGCTEAPAAVAPQPPKVTVMHPEQRELTNYEEFNGWMAADKTVEVRARVRGHIKKVNFTDGQYVKKGDLLFELDPRPFQADISAIEDKVRIYEAQKIAADRDAARYRELLPQRAASLKDLDKAEATAASFGAEIEATKNQLERSKLELEYSKITADIDGRVSKAQLTEGNLVNAGGTDPLLTTIVSVDPVRIEFNVDERSMQRYADSIGAQGGNITDVLEKLKDQKATFKFARDGETGFTHEGTLQFGDNRIDPSTGTVQVYGTVPNKDKKFIPGARVRVRLTIGKPYKANLVPDTAVLADQGKRYVLIVDDKKRAKRRDITLGTLTDDGMRAITPDEKLAEGETVAQWLVIIDNLQRVRLNEPVDAEQPAAAKAAPEKAASEKAVPEKAAK
jgi:RND family efflux transporter MFP subunit